MFEPGSGPGPTLTAILIAAAAFVGSLFGAAVGRIVFSRPRAPSRAAAVVRLTHELWCDTNMPNAAYWASVGQPIRCNCDDTGPGSMRAVIAAFDTYRAAEARLGEVLGEPISPLPSVDEIIARDRERRS